MVLKFCQLAIALCCLLLCSGCEGDKKESSLDDLDRMAIEKVQVLQHQKIADAEAEKEINQQLN